MAINKIIRITVQTNNHTNQFNHLISGQNQRSTTGLNLILIHLLYKTKRSQMNAVAERLKNMDLYKLVERILAGICILIPLILILVDNNGKDIVSIRHSISNYVYMEKSYVFGSLLTIAALLFFFNGILHFRDNRKDRKKPQAKWYNAVLGLSLFGVIFFPHNQLSHLHNASAILFFGGSIVVIALFHDNKDRWLSWIIAALATLSYVLHFLIPDFYGANSLFWAEWISLAVIGIHFILESIGDRTAQ